MKRSVKAVVVTAVAMALGGVGTSVNAASLYDEEGTQFDIYGRLAMGVAGGGPGVDSAGQKVSDSAEFVDVYSRLGFRMSQRVSSDVSAFGRLEWRFTGDERNTEQGFNEIRQSYLGLKSERYGTVQAGNFDSLYYQFVSAPFDVYLDRGLEFSSTGLQSRGDAIGYYTPTANGFTTFLQVKHYSERGLTDAEQRREGSVLAAQGGVHYQHGPLRVGVGAVEDVVRGGGNGEMLYGVMGSYQATDSISARLGAEWQGQNTQYGGGYETVGLGTTYVTGPWAFTADYYRINRDNQGNSNAWAAGSYYKLSNAFDVFVELADSDAPGLAQRGGLKDAYWLTGARYHF
ncbi:MULTISPECIES: porin [unclassified Halomonas]|jgi:predicted porin|uniref:porin n=1 Tax=unclassified Halomonas TaxID=2609666 RepID=UPI001EF4E7CC|nr:MULTISPECIES: porin [unclassified Halomonas]MCG7591973.1 porin [Halomonas sp. McD50-5]MCG7617940.1 porin [Halomonas sp. McD50-4]